MRAGFGAPFLLLAMILGAGPAAAGPPFQTDDPVPVDLGHWEVYGFSQATHVRGDSNGTLPGVEVNYGVAPELQLHVIAPLAFDRPAGGPWRSGIGDLELGAKYRFVQEDADGWRPMLAIFPAVLLPTGDADRNLGTGHMHAFLPLWLEKNFGAWQVNAGGGYWINPGGNNKNYWFAGWQLQRQITDQLALGGELFHQSADRIGGSDTSGFNLGGVFDITENHHLLFSAGRGLQNVAETNEFSYYVAYQLTF